MTAPSAVQRIKICCIQSVEEAWLAIDAGASALGFVSAMPSGPGVIAEDRIAAIIAVVPPAVATFLLTSRLDVDGIVEQQRRTGANTLQLCDLVEAGGLRRLRSLLPGISIVQVIHVSGEDAVAEAIAVAPDVNALLLDTGDRSAAVKELGGTGRRHDWRISKRIRSAVDVPVFLAGGLDADNVGEAIRVVAPFGVDVCSGLRPDGALDAIRLRQFVAAVHAVEVSQDG